MDRIRIVGGSKLNGTIAMCASFWVIAPLLARMNEAWMALPDGCAIGTRPVDLLITALEKPGAEIAIDGGDVIAKRLEDKLSACGATIERISG